MFAHNQSAHSHFLHPQAGNRHHFHFSAIARSFARGQMTGQSFCKTAPSNSIIINLCNRSYPPGACALDLYWKAVQGKTRRRQLIQVCELLDLEISPVDAAARRSIDSKGMSGSVDVVAGDMFAELPSGHDVHLFANALHDWDIGSVRTLVANSFESLASGGRIVVFDAHLNREKNGPLSIAE